MTRWKVRYSNGLWFLYDNHYETPSEPIAASDSPSMLICVAANVQQTVAA